MSNIINWPIEFTHQQTHIKMLENFQEIINEFKIVLETYPEEIKEHIPRFSDGTINFNEFSIFELYNWILIQSKNPDHKHEDNDEFTTKTDH